jgi:HAD superfamily hydrolase (TIGR01490 family)
MNDLTSPVTMTTDACLGDAAKAPDAPMTLALFDLDDTLLDGDITGLWSQWLIDLGWIEDGDAYRAAFAEHMAAYAAGTLDMEAHLALLLTPLAGRSEADVRQQVDAFLEAEVVPRLFPQGHERLAWHRDQGHRVVIISASPIHVVGPLAERLGADQALATALEIDSRRRYTGKAEGIRTFQGGKLEALREWLAEHTPVESFGYSDSRNDLPLLEFVDRPFAINPDSTLDATARERGWPVQWWRQVD